MGSEDGQNDYHRFHILRTARAVGFKATLTREPMWPGHMSPVLWSTHAIMPAMPIVDYRGGLLAQAFPKASPARDRDFKIAPQPYHPELVPPSRVSATRTPAFRRRISGLRLTRDFLHYPHSTQEPHDNGIDRAIYRMRRSLYHGRPFGSYVDPLIVPVSFDVHLT